MRTIDVITKFINKKFYYSASNLRSEQDKLIHYSTVIAQQDNNEIILNNTFYSTSTSKIQNTVMKLADDKNIKFHTVLNIPKNTTNLLNS